jgi:diadenosine tetraphosphatase ApaH/serine/threonine PP2A family protein phosphatase
VVELPPLRDHKESLVVVGDLHGQLPDLDALFQRVGYPSALNRFVFNGDFVDRGESSVEVVCVLLAYLLALPPGAVHLNRGNHEDRLLAQVYGFRAELAHKYGEPDAQQLYDSFVQLFEALPLLAVLREADGARHGDERGGGGGGGLAIVHAGLPLSREGAGMGVPELAAALRSVPHSHGLLDSVIGEKEQEQEEEEEEEAAAAGWRSGAQSVRAICRDLLWSDPDPDQSAPHGTRPNVARGGAGVLFSHAFAAAWLQSQGLHTLVRSHQVVHDGAQCEDLPPPPPPPLDHGPDGEVAPEPAAAAAAAAAAAKAVPDPVLPVPLYQMWTVFSASNYPAHTGLNQGAALRWVGGGRGGRLLAPDVVRWTADELAEPEPELELGQEEPGSTGCEVERRTVSTLRRLIWAHRHRLLAAFEARARSEGQVTAGRVSTAGWAAVMAEVLRLEEVALSSLQPVLAPPVLRLVTPPGGSRGFLVPTDKVCFNRFLTRHASDTATDDVDGAGDGAGNGDGAGGNDGDGAGDGAGAACDLGLQIPVPAEAVHALYNMTLSEIKLMFDYIDSDGDGVISRDEFIQSVTHLEVLRTTEGGASCEHGDPELEAAQLYEICDVRKTGGVTLNQFAELFRLTRRGQLVTPV